MNIIKDENDLEFPEDGKPGRRDYVRHLIDPTILIAARSGECYTRRDGAKWEHAGYTCTREINPSTSVVKEERDWATAPEDSARYRPTDEANAA